MDYDFDYFDEPDPDDTWDEEDNYADPEDYDPYMYWGPDVPPTRIERLQWRLESIGWKLRHPVPELRTMWRERVVWRWFRKCQTCGKRGTWDGIGCRDHSIPF